MLNLEFLGWAGGNGDSLANQILVMQSRLGGECNFFGFFIALLLCSDRAAFAPHCLCMGNPAHLAWENCRLRKKPFLLVVGTGGKSTSEQQSHCWELAVAAQLISLQPCKTIVNFKLLIASVVALKHVGLKGFLWEILQRNWN